MTIVVRSISDRLRLSPECLVIGTAVLCFGLNRRILEKSSRERPTAERKLRRETVALDTD